MDTGIIFLLAVIILLASIGITCLILRWIFRVKRQLWNQRQQLELLMLIAEQLGVNREKFTHIGRGQNINDEYLHLKDFQKI